MSLFVYYKCPVNEYYNNQQFEQVALKHGTENEKWKSSSDVRTKYKSLISGNYWQGSGREGYAQQYKKYQFIR